MIPELIDLGAGCIFPVLPPGIHKTNLEEVEECFAYSPHRRRLFEGFCLGFQNLVAAGCSAIYLNGSYTTGKIHPGDFDACWEVKGVDPRKIDKTLLNFSNKRAAQKSKYGGEYFIADSDAVNGVSYLDYFQRDRETGRKKGILLLECKYPKK